MWKTPGRELIIFTPRDVRGLLVGVYNATQRAAFQPDARSLPIVADVPVFGQLPTRTLAWECHKLIEQLVTDRAVPEGGPHALMECLLYHLFMDQYRIAAQFAFARTEPGAVEVVAAIDAIRARAGQPPLATIKRPTAIDAEDTMKRLFFSSFAWRQVGCSESLIALQKEGGRKSALLGVSPGYFRPGVRQPTPTEWEDSVSRFDRILAWSKNSPAYLPCHHLG